MKYNLFLKFKKWITENEDSIREYIREIVTSGNCLLHEIYLEYKNGEIQLHDLQSVGTRSYLCNYDNIYVLLYLEGLNYLAEQYDEELEYAIEVLKKSDPKEEINMEYFDSDFWDEIIDNYFDEIIESLEYTEKYFKDEEKILKYKK